MSKNFSFHYLFLFKFFYFLLSNENHWKDFAACERCLWFIVRDNEKERGKWWVHRKNQNFTAFCFKSKVKRITKVSAKSNNWTLTFRKREREGGEGQEREKRARDQLRTYGGDWENNLGLLVASVNFKIL